MFNKNEYTLVSVVHSYKIEILKPIYIQNDMKSHP